MKKHCKSKYIRVLLITLSICCAPLAAKAAYPMLYGVTEGSVYKEYVRIYWFEEGAQATISVDGGSPSSYTKGAQISGTGSYRIELSLISGAETFSNAVDFQVDTSLSFAALKTNDDPKMTGLTIEFEPNTYSGSPFIVVWAEDMAGNFLQNLYISTAAATNYMRFGNSLVNRPQAVPYWAHKTCPETTTGSGVYVADPKIPLPEGLDGVSGATQKNGFQLDTHVLAPRSGTQIRVLLEINQSYDNGWYFALENPVAEETDGASGVINFGDDHYFRTSNEPSLIYAVEVALDQPGIFTTIEPTGYGHYGGRTGSLYTDFYALHEGTERYKFDKANHMVDHISVTVHELPGDVTGDCVVDLRDAITGLKVCAGDTVEVNSNGDVGTDERIGLEEVIYVLDQSVQ